MVAFATQEVLEREEAHDPRGFCHILMPQLSVRLDDCSVKEEEESNPHYSVANVEVVCKCPIKAGRAVNVFMCTCFHTTSSYGIMKPQHHTAVCCLSP